MIRKLLAIGALFVATSAFADTVSPPAGSYIRNQLTPEQPRSALNVSSATVRRLTISGLSSIGQCLTVAGGGLITSAACGASGGSGPTGQVLPAAQFSIGYYSGFGSTTTIAGAPLVFTDGAGTLSAGTLNVTTGLATLYAGARVKYGGYLQFETSTGGSGASISNVVGLDQQALTIYASDGLGLGGNNPFISAPGPLVSVVSQGFGILGSSASGVVTYSGFKGATSVEQDVLWTLPVKDGTVGQAMVTDGFGALSFATVAGSGGASAGDSFGSHVATKTVTMGYGFTATTGSVTGNLVTGPIAVLSGEMIGLSGQAGIRFFDSDSTDNIQIMAPTVATTYALYWPGTQGAASTFLRNDGAGNLTWAAAGGSGGASYLEMIFGAARSSPTATIIGNSSQFSGSVSGSTMTFSLNASSVTLAGNNIIRLTSTLQDGATAHISSATVRTLNAYNLSVSTFSMPGFPQNIPLYFDPSGALNARAIRLTDDITGTLPVQNGGTGASSYTDGQILIGDSTTGGLNKASLTAGSNVTITNGTGTITISAAGGGGGGASTLGVTVGPAKSTPTSDILFNPDQMSGSVTSSSITISLLSSSVTLQGNTLGGDVTGTLAASIVGDDSHAHTGSSISGVDISADTNLAAINGVILTGDTVSVSSVSLSSQVVGNLPVTNLNSGTSATSSTFWRGDATWATPSSGGGDSFGSHTATKTVTATYGIVTSTIVLNSLGGNYVGFKASDTVSGNVTWTLPAADGTAGQILKTNGTGDLAWTTPNPSQITNLLNTTVVAVGATATNLTELETTLAANSTYFVECYFLHSTTTTTTGVAYGFDMPGSSRFTYNAMIAVANDALDGFYEGNGTTDIDLIVGTGVPSSNVPYAARMWASVGTDASGGTITPVAACELAGLFEATIRPGSYCTYRKL